MLNCGLGIALQLLSSPVVITAINSTNPFIFVMETVYCEVRTTALSIICMKFGLERLKCFFRPSCSCVYIIDCKLDPLHCFNSKDETWNMHTWRLRETAGSIIDSRCAVFLLVSRAVAYTVKLIVLHTHTHTHKKCIYCGAIDDCCTDSGFTKYKVDNCSCNLMAHSNWTLLGDN